METDIFSETKIYFKASSDDLLKHLLTRCHVKDCSTRSELMGSEDVSSDGSGAGSQAEGREWS